MTDAEVVKGELIRHAEEVARHLFPRGKRIGNNWCVGSIKGEPGQSFKICVAGEKVGLWGDFDGTQKHQRSLIDLWMEKHGVDFKTALQQCGNWLGVTVDSRSVSHCDSKKKAASTITSFNWQACVDAFTDKNVQQIAKWRGHSVELWFWLRQKGLVGLYSGLIGFPVHDRAGNVVAVHYRLKDGTWRYYPEGTKVRPLVIGELIAGDPCHSFESYFDAFSFMDESGERIGIIITRGASNGAFAAGLVPETSTVYVWTQNDPAGEKWQNTTYANTKATVKRAKIPAPHKDLNDWTRAGATADDLLAAMANAKVVHGFEGFAGSAGGQELENKKKRFLWPTCLRLLKRWRKKFARPSACRRVLLVAVRLEF